MVTGKTLLDTHLSRHLSGRIYAIDTDVLNHTAGNQLIMRTCIANEPAIDSA